METCFYEGGNEHETVRMASGVKYMAKHSSPTILSHTKRQTPFRAADEQQQGKSLRPEIVQDALTKLKFFL